MASMQCYRPSNDCCQQKSHENVFKGHDQQGHHGHYPAAAGQTQCYGQMAQTHGYYPDHAKAKSESHLYSQTMTHQQGHTNGHFTEQHSMAKTHSDSHGKTFGHNTSYGMVCHGKTEKKIKEKKSEHKTEKKIKEKKSEYKEKSVYKKKEKSCNRSCSDGSSSGSDSD